MNITFFNVNNCQKILGVSRACGRQQQNQQRSVRLIHKKVDTKVVSQYENPDDPDHHVVSLFVKHLLCLPTDVPRFYCQPLPDDDSGIPRYETQPMDGASWVRSFQVCVQRSWNFKTENRPL